VQNESISEPLQSDARTSREIEQELQEEMLRSKNKKATKLETVF
jgi:hypothetical protein